MKRVSRIVTQAAVALSLFLAAPAIAQDNFIVSLSGSCPGTVTVTWSGAAPNHKMAILWGPAEGQSVIPGGSPCSGTHLGIKPLNMIQVPAILPTGPQGTGRVSGTANQSLCGGFIQLIVNDPSPYCTTSNVAPMP
jgi:hypothetical protein